MSAQATLFCFTVRDETGRISLDPAEHLHTINTLRESTDGRLILQLELDIANGASAQELETIIRAAKPDCCLFKLNQLLPRNGGDEDESAARDLLDCCAETGVDVQIALNDPTDIDWFYAFRQYGTIPESCSTILFVLGEDGEPPRSDPHLLRGFLAGMEKQKLLGKISWSVAAYGPQEISALTAAMALGGHIAPGFAYNIHSVEGDVFTSPNDQLAVIGEVADRLGRPAASAFEARTLLFGTR